jgi:hypothetical protein
MKTITTLNDTKLEFLTKSTEISAKRWNRFNVESIKASDLGQDFMEAAAKLDAMNKHLKFGNNQAWKAENENLRIQLFSCYHGINFSARALGFLLNKKNGEKVDPFDMTVEDLELLIEESEVTQDDLESIVREVRKK